MSVIEINHLTKSYGEKKGNFDLNFKIEKGEVFGYLGPNGAGKTTTIRQLLGFIKPEQGECKIMDLDCTKKAVDIQQNLGYLPGEIAFMGEMKGHEFIKFIAEMRGMKDFTKMNRLCKMFDLDTSGSIKRMSKGMKQKIGIVCAFMHDPDVLILDEPTSGLDPLMQSRFVELILEEKKQGKTILMSSHMFEEVSKTCDRIGIIKDGKLLVIEDALSLKSKQHKKYVITFNDNKSAEAYKNNSKFKITEIKDNQVTLRINGDIQPLIDSFSGYKISDLDVIQQSLEEIFMHFYGEKQ